MNEALCNVLCHNIAVLIHAMFDIEISIKFGEPFRAKYGEKDEVAEIIKEKLG